jgi:hypothetical protein
MTEQTKVRSGWTPSANLIKSQVKMNLDVTFKVGDRVKFVPRLGHVEEGVILAVFETTAGTELNIAFGKGLSACVNARQVVEKMPSVN